MFIVEWICPDGIIPDSSLSGLNNTYIFIYGKNTEVENLMFVLLWFTFYKRLLNNGYR